MTQFLVAIHHREDYDPAREEDDTMARDIDALNDEMTAANVRVFVGGLLPASNAKSLRVQSNGEVVMTEGPYLQTCEHVGGFWILDVATMNDALQWGRKAALACRAPVEVLPFYDGDGDQG